MSAMVTILNVTLSQDFPCHTDFQKDFIPDFISFHKGLLSGIIRQSDLHIGFYITRHSRLFRRFGMELNWDNLDTLEDFKKILRSTECRTLCRFLCRRSRRFTLQLRGKTGKRSNSVGYAGNGG